MTKKIAIIGAGCSGLTAIKCCLDEGLVPVCFEKYDCVGGLWKYRDSVEHDYSGIYSSLVTNTCKEMSCFSDFPMPENYPCFLPHRFVLDYLKLYSQYFGLTKFINFNTLVLRIIQAPDYEVSGRWVVTYANTASPSQRFSETFDGIMLCSGHLRSPNRPNIPGLDKFSGQVSHSASYRKPYDFEGKRVLIVGIGNSAADIACDVSRNASQVFISTRHGAWVFNKMGFWGYPLDAIANCRASFFFDYRVLQWFVEKLANFRFDHEKYGVKAGHRALEAHPTISDELPHRIMVGAVKIKSSVIFFTQNGAQFDDGSFEDIDTVILATGYKYAYDYLDKDTLDTHANETTLYKYTFPPHHRHHTMAAIGLVQSVGSVIPISELQSRWFTRVIKGLVKLPTREEMCSMINKKKQQIGKQFIPSLRHTIETMWVPFMDEIADEIGVRPDLWALARKDLWFAIRCFIGPCVPAQYRLMGPGQWSGAKNTVKGVFHRSVYGLQTRTPYNKRVRKSSAIFSSKRLTATRVCIIIVCLFLLLRFLHCLLWG